MELKKHEKHNLDSKRPLFFNIGLVIALSLTIAAFNWKGQYEGMVIERPVEEFEPFYEIPITKMPEPEPPKPRVMAPKPKPTSTVAFIISDLPEVDESEPLDLDNDIDIDLSEDIDNSQYVEVPDDPFLIVEDMPSFPGGLQAFYQYVAKNLDYPRIAKRMGVSGKVTLEFVIDRDGRIIEVKTVKGIGFGCDEEAMEVLKNSPKWNPGKQRGQEVKVRMVLPIWFKLN